MTAHSLDIAGGSNASALYWRRRQTTITGKGMFSIEPSVVKPVVTRVDNYDWNALTTELNNYGYAVMGKIINRGECAEIASLYSNEEYFRSRINMSRHGFGKGEY